MNSVLIICEFVFLLICAAFFSGTETAVTAITHTQYKMIKKSRSKKNKRLAFLIEKKDEIVSATLIGTNFVNTLSSALVTAFVISNYGAAYIPAATAITAVLIIIFAEIVPKAFAAYRPVEITKGSARILTAVHIILKPAIFVFSKLSSFIIKAFSKNRPAEHSSLSEDFLKTLINISLADGTFHTGEHDLIRRAVQLHELKLHNIMTKKENIVGFNIDASFEGMIDTFKTSMFSRLPVFDSGKDTIIGLVHYKDLLFYLAHTNKIDIRKIIRPAIFIPETANIFSAIRTMSKNKRNMAFVIDEYGTIEGLVTIDDITAAVFGVIQDEYSKVKVNPLQGLGIVDGTKMRIPAAVPIGKINEILNTDFHSEHCGTIGGLILEKTEYLPQEGETVKIDKITFTVEKVKNSKIISLIADVSELVFP